ncbi:MAG: hypothetical protein ACM3YN_05750 [Parcubacteria group bacterium]
MNKPLDHDSIAKAMKEAAWVAKHGTREERSGRFIAPHASSKSGEPVSQKRRS